MPRSIRGQIAAVMVGAFMASAVTAATVFFFMGAPHFPAKPGSTLAELAVAARLIDNAGSPAARLAIMRAVRASFPDLAVETEPIASDRVTEHDPIVDALARELGMRFKVYATKHSDEAPVVLLRLAVQLPDGTTLFTSLPFVHAAVAGPGLIRALIFLACTIGLLSFWAARALAAPLTRFADAAERFTGEGSSEPLGEEGPQEIRRAAKALNEMRARIRRLIEERTLMLAAVSHDLRTPVTRLRLRAEDIEAPELRRQFLGDLLTIQGLIQSALWFLRGEAKAGRHVQVDLSSLVQTVCDGFADMGRDVTFSGPPQLKMRGDPDQLTRALANLLDNALKFGKSADVRAYPVPTNLVVEVKDDGPGIPDAEKERATQPFYRGDAARNLDDSDSFGLGLSVARAVAEAHGGTLELLDPPRGGLLARLTLPDRLSAGHLN
jgi:signal transduction histidine kinase